ncbi:MAG: dockerin type I repeat-containing protein, partial [Clostridia bacterium]|nr:dockerin type I repeat-containing protein [Clostridia bacterium]
GVTVSGTVTSFNSNTDEITVALYKEGSASADYTATVKGNSASYTLSGVAAGTYTMKVSKNNHVTREYELTVGTGNVTQDVKIHLKGDINGDGRVNTTDVGRANAHAKKTNLLSGYELSCADVSGDGKVNTTDVGRMNAHAKKTNLMW